MNRAAVSIPEKLFFKIGEVCDITGVQAHVLRYWESEFPMLAPQKNRAGQRTYRKRDVEMVLRIKELLYEDQYTIAGAKKKLVSELRGASKLKVVTPEMSASASQQSMMPTPPAPPMSDPLASAPPSPAPTASVSIPAPPRESFEELEAGESAPELNEERRAAVRRLQSELRELLLLLDAGDSAADARRR
jgi:DNA-binding transcriptional MerR regulator